MNLNLIEKEIRADVIKAHMQERGIKKAVCFTCGNASHFLREIGVDVLSIGKGQDLEPTRWFTQEEIARHFPEHFNATSGDLPMSLMSKIAKTMRFELGDDFEGGRIKVGSGETLIVLCLAYPELKEKMEPYRDSSQESKREEQATLNPLLDSLFHVERQKAPFPTEESTPLPHY